MILFVIFLFFCINAFFSHGVQTTISSVDTISTNRPLFGNQTIVSSGANFELGFFTPGNSSKYYIGIWYKKVREKTIVWVANRETPISDKNSAQLKISDGNLVLFNESQIKIWSTTSLNSTAATDYLVVATLLDDGNLVLRNGTWSNSGTVNETLWESFDNPAHTWMPGAKMAYNKRTKMKTTITSWRNSEDPSPGLFSMEYDPKKTQYVMMWNKSVQYWTSGSWKRQSFSESPLTGSNYIFDFSYVDNENETYLMYWLHDQSIVTNIIMDVSGQAKLFSWDGNSEWDLFWSQPRKQCEVYGYCGAFATCNENSLPFCRCLPGFEPMSDTDWNLNAYSGGCVREISLECENNGTNFLNRRKDKFMMNSNVRLPEYSQSLAIRSKGECESMCLSFCTCTAYSYGENECLIWNAGLLNLQQLSEVDGNGKTIHIRLSASSSVFSSTKNNGKRVAIGAIVGSIVVLLVVMAILTAIFLNRQKGNRRTLETPEGSLAVFKYKDLQNATKNFSIKLGEGGFGYVYKGILPDSSVVAVKKLKTISQGEKQFRTEVGTIGMIQHVNLVRLRGFCAQGNKKLLVYNYMENGSLNSHLFNDKFEVLRWNTRYEIALGIARGLEYLHEECRDYIIHCDIKPENVLLDAEFCPKVADFGLAKLMGRNFSRVLTTLRGTIGYLAPEWISGFAITTKADVYSYGMILFELVSGKRNSTQDEKAGYFPALAANVMIEGGDILGLLDPRLEGHADLDEVLRICKVACWCIQGDESIRPSMGQVVRILEGVMNINLPPIPRWLQVLVENLEHIY